jgi:predicted ATPase with chaperone activity
MVYTPENKGMLSVVNDENAETLLKRAANEEKINVVVKAMTLNQVLSESIGEGGHLDLMILDIEGYETKALKNVNFEKYFIDYILVEELQESDEITNILKPYYERIDKITEQDYLYKRK